LPRLRFHASRRGKASWLFCGPVWYSFSSLPPELLCDFSEPETRRDSTPVCDTCNNKSSRLGYVMKKRLRSLACEAVTRADPKSTTEDQARLCHSERSEESARSRGCREWIEATAHILPGPAIPHCVRNDMDEDVVPGFCSAFHPPVGGQHAIAPPRDASCSSYSAYSCHMAVLKTWGSGHISCPLALTPNRREGAQLCASPVRR
jgi:hypothetical protein